MRLTDLKAKPFYSFPPALRGALKIVPWFQVFIYLPFFLQPFSLSGFMATFMAHAILFPLFFYVFWQRTGKAILTVSVLTLCAFVTTFYSLSAIGFFAFSAAACSAISPLAQRYVLLAVVTASYLLAGGLNHHSLYLILVGLFFTAVNGVNFSIQLEKYVKDRVVKQSQQEVHNLATAAERERIGRDLHDLLGHSLTSITLKAELIERLLESDTKVCKLHLQDVKRIARSALSEVRDTVTQYKSSTLCNEYTNARKLLESVNIELDASLDDIHLEPVLDNTLALLVREAVTNVVRHSDAMQCSLRLESSVDKIQLSFRDNGRIVGTPPMGNGLTGMQERCQELGGELLVRFEGGCHLTAILPKIQRPRES